MQSSGIKKKRQDKNDKISIHVM